MYVWKLQLIQTLTDDYRLDNFIKQELSYCWDGRAMLHKSNNENRNVSVLVLGRISQYNVVDSRKLPL